MHRGPWVAGAVLVVLAVVGLLALGSSLRTGRAGYVGANVSVIDALPAYPGASRSDLSSAKTGAGGWRTEAFFDAPGSTPQAVWSFYAQRLPALGWSGGGDPAAGAVRWRHGRELLLVFSGAPGRYSLVVDSRGGGS